MPRSLASSDVQRPRRRGRATTPRRTITRRTKLVWLSFFAAMTLVSFLLAMGESGVSGGFLIATSVGSLGDEAGPDPIFRTEVPLDRARWQGIVIHDLGMPAGDPERINRLHQSYGYQGLGYHFLIGNGNGLGDGIIHVGYRWNDQLPGAHVSQLVEHSADWNNHTIGICLIGNGDRRPFTDNQMRSLVSLVRRLQKELNLPAERVYLHRDLAPGITSPGRYFAAATLREQLLP